MILYVNKVVRAGDRFERMVCQVLSGVATCSRHEQRRAVVHGFGGDVVGPIIREVERLSGLKDKNEEVESLFICESAPECRGGKSGKKQD